jgi:transposase InsO family protein
LRPALRASQEQPHVPGTEASPSRRTAPRAAVSSPDNGPAYRSIAHAALCRQLGIRHLFTRPYRPKTNGKAERLIRTLLTEWAYAAAYPTSAARTRALAAFLTRYNTTRPHKALGGIPPAKRLAERINPPAAYT